MSPFAAAAHQVARGDRLLGRRRIRGALAAYRRAVALGLDPGEGVERRWVSAMLLGRFAEAWAESDRVIAERRRSGAGCLDRPEHLRWVWDGTPLAGRRVLVRCYHGLGDTLQFIRFVAPLRRLARQVAVECQPALLPLLAPLGGIDAIGPPGSQAAGAEVEIELMELPHALRATLDRLPPVPPALAAAGIAARSPRAPGAALRVGLAWAGGDWDARRSLPPRCLAALAGLPGVAFHSLQRGPAARLPAGLPAPAFRNPGDDSMAVLDTVRLMRRLDLVISIDSMVAHLAGSLMLPVWTLLHRDADWRWLAGRRDSPWYPTMRLYRQRRPGDWAPVLDAVRRDLAALAAR
ncbi:MAG: hypothetical protein U1E53_07300 [Dongiaceae bacterium]